ncbi:hypothetical protein [Pseudomonas sp. ICMP 561]|uniref:hypothetical protein n=1 Tax=Pseudomonas sp. ICMP 561 TaxID=1718918 RepID=UPI00114596B5|nr:hypothetical protein [Pseudomonas sp. ICMP 561]
MKVGKQLKKIERSSLELVFSGYLWLESLVNKLFIARVRFLAGAAAGCEAMAQAKSLRSLRQLLQKTFYG